MKPLLMAAALALAASEALAQGLPLPIPMRPRPRPAPPGAPAAPSAPDISWFGTLEEGLGHAQEDGRVLVYYVFAEEKDRFVAAFRNERVRQLGEQSFIFVFQPLAKDNPVQQELHVGTAPTWVGMDKYGNFLDVLPGTRTAEEMYAWMNKLIGMAKAQADLIESKSAQAHQMFKKNAQLAIRALVELAALPKKGYPQIAAAADALAALADEPLQRAERLLGRPETEKEGSAALDGVVRTFKGSARVDLMIAALLRRRGDIPAACARIEKAAADPRSPERDRARQLQAEMIAEGIEKLRAALQLGIDGRFEEAKSRIRALKASYATTEVARHADEILNDLEGK